VSAGTKEEEAGQNATHIVSVTGSSYGTSLPIRLLVRTGLGVGAGVGAGVDAGVAPLGRRTVIWVI
jgi:hypothetical protein